MLNSTVVPGYVPAAIATDITRAVDTLTALGVPADRLDVRCPDVLMLMDCPIAYSVWMRGTVNEIAPLLVPLCEAGIGWNVITLTNAAALFIQFHAVTWAVNVGRDKYRFGRDCAGFWGADSVYGGG